MTQVQNNINTTTTQRMNSIGLIPDPQKVFLNDNLNLNCLKKLKGKSIISSKQFNLELINEILKLAAYLEANEIAPYHPLDGKIAITAFFEASTRTRLSFESAFLRLGGKIISVPDGGTTGVAKGESLSDIGEMFNAYGDLLVMRHTDTDSITQIKKYMSIPLINGGNGTGEHPTQALADWYALKKWNPKLGEDLKPEDKIHIGIIGTPGSMRAVKSFLLTSLLFNKSINKITVVSEMSDPLGADVSEYIKQTQVKLSVIHDLKQSVEQFDVVYINSIAYLGDSYKSLDSRFKISPTTSLKRDSVILHPLARNSELHTDLDDTQHNLYFNQAAGAVFVRQALLVSILDRLEYLPIFKN